jgi:CheY-like chemotaxis protein
VADYLRSKSFTVIVARNGREALARAREAVPDLILMDVQMPEQDGLSVIRALRADPDPVLRDVPIVALTALAMAGDRERCLDAGADVYVTKPVSLKALLEVVESHRRR